MKLFTLDTEQARIMGVFTLCSADKTDFFMFETAGEVQAFLKYYYYNPIGAVFAYKRYENERA